MENSFHEIVGQYITLHGQEAFRGNASKFDNGLCYSKLPLTPWKPFSVRISRVTKKWRGGVTVGVMAASPESLELQRQPYACAPYGLDDALARKNVPYFFLTGLTKPCGQILHHGECAVSVAGRGALATLHDIVTIVMTDDKWVYCLLNSRCVECLGRFSADVSTVYAVLDINSNTVGLKPQNLPSLFHRCRTVIRQNLNSPNLGNVDKLPLPPMILAYLKFLPSAAEEAPVPI